MLVTKGPLVFTTVLCISTGVLCQQNYNVTYSSTSICGLKGSFVDMSCTYSYPSDRQIRETFWHISWFPEIPTDLSLDSKYQGRVEYLRDKVNNCSLRIKDLRESDIKEKYRFRLRTDDPKGTFSGSEVSLSLTDLHVTVSPATVKEGDRVTLTCSTTCSLSNNPTYIWYRNSQPLSNIHTTSSNTLSIPSFRKEDNANYSCAVRGHEAQPSPSVFVQSWQDYNVTYSSTSICGFKGSFVDIPCTYSYPSNRQIIETFWHINWFPDTPTDLNQDSRYQGRVEYLGGNTNNCTLRIKDLRESDIKGKYRFRLRTDDPKGTFSGSEVSLSLTDLHVTVSREFVSAGEKVTLTCSSICSLSNNPTYIWYKNSQPHKHTADNRLAKDSVSAEDAGEYSCAVQGHEIHSSPAQTLSVRYGPRHTLASVHPSGDLVEGSSVTLTCSSDANPPAHRYAWYKETGNQSSQVGSSQNYSLADINSGQSGRYYCMAENVIGQNRSSVVELNVKCNCWTLVVGGIIGGLLAGLVTGALFGAMVYKRMTQAREGRGSSTAEMRGTTAGSRVTDSSNDTYTALNPRTISPEYDTLANLKVSADGATYTPAASVPTELPDYEN
ncbi:B-cell receptor CD22-like isoform X1 [Alosa alosa]|uniref:B-cell receptor CD22-like isoform X1 n=1 Tax=Alosa alosa TaxID=278164 RepID=UPI0020152F9E|nr:B-cell receptor CD22-like isoform X1 [Alosa alosa]